MGRFGQGVGVAVRSGAAPLLLGMRWAGARDEPHAEVPGPRWNVALASKAAIDEAFFASELVLANVVSRSGIMRFARELPEALEMYRERGWLDDPLRYHADPPPLCDVESSFRRAALLDYRHIRFESGYAPHLGEPGRERWLDYADNRTAHAWILEHPGAPRPWMLCIPGYRMGQPFVDFAGFRARWMHRRLGLNVAIPVMPLHGPRRQGRRGGDGFFTGDFIDTVHAQAQAVWDARRVVSWLRGRGAERIGVHGVSLGGYTAALFAGLEGGLACAIAGIPAVDFLRLVKAQMPRFLVRAVDWAGFSLDNIGELLRVVSPLSLAPRVPHRNRYVYAGLADQLCTPDHARDLWDHWDRPQVAWYQGSHVSFLWENDVREFLSGALQQSGLVVDS